MGSIQSWRCAHCGALTRTWRGHMCFAQVGSAWRPTCFDQLACKARRKDPPEGEFWLDAKDCPQKDKKPEAAPVLGAAPVYSNLLGDDGLVWCFGCKPIGIAAVESSDRSCHWCGE